MANVVGYAGRMEAPAVPLSWVFFKSTGLVLDRTLDAGTTEIRCVSLSLSSGLGAKRARRRTSSAGRICPTSSMWSSLLVLVSLKATQPRRCDFSLRNRLIQSSYKGRSLYDRTRMRWRSKLSASCNSSWRCSPRWEARSCT